MPLDIGKLTPTELIRLVNSTPLGPVLSPTKVNRQMNRAGYRIGDGRRIHLAKYASWLAGDIDKPKTSKQSVADARAAELAAKNAARRAAQDIGPLPEVEDPERRSRACEDFMFFCETYFPDVYYLPWSDDHLRVIEKIEIAVTQGGLFAFAMPRGSGKSVLARTAALWAILTGKRRYVCLIGSAAIRARSLLQGIQAALLMPDSLLLADFPEVVFPIQALENSAHKQRGQRYQGELTFPLWTSDKIVIPAIPGSIASGSVITVDGLDSNIRGQQHSTIDGQVIRPDLVLIDDPQTRESARSPDQTAKRLAILNGDLLGMSGPGRKISGLLTCTKIYDNDLADRILDRKRNPEWQGECTKMVYAFPTDEKLWDQYAHIRNESLREGDGGKEATDFYRRNREEMDAGAKVAWPARHNDDELSALQHAMNLKFRDEPAFFAEYQNEPMQEQEDEVLTPDQMVEKFNGRKRGEIPLGCNRVTMFIDVHDKLLFYVVCAWEDDFTGYVVDYGAYPDQRRAHFTMRNATRTLGRLTQGVGKEGAVQAGLEKLVTDSLARDWRRADGALLRIEKLLVDSGYLPGVVEAVKHKAGGAAMVLSKGVGITAGRKPMSAYRRKPGETHGHHWYFPSIRRSGEFRHILVDTNYWKSFIHARLATTPGDRGALTLFGTKRTNHALFAQHVAGSETSALTHGHGRDVREWRLKPLRPDNHWLDCLVGCAVAASIQGVTLGGVHQPIEAPPRRKRVSLDEIQHRRRA